MGRRRGASDARPPVEGSAAKPSPMAAALSSLLLCAALAGCVPGGSSAACGRSLPTLEPERARPGETVLLRGGGFGGGCDDSNLPFRPKPPQKDIRVEMRQGGKTWPLATLDAGPRPDYAIRKTLRVPEDARPGKATVVVDAGESRRDKDEFDPLPVPFRVTGDGPG